MRPEAAIVWLPFTLLYLYKDYHLRGFSHIWYPSYRNFADGALKDSWFCSEVSKWQSTWAGDPLYLRCTNLPFMQRLLSTTSVASWRLLISCTTSYLSVHEVLGRYILVILNALKETNKTLSQSHIFRRPVAQWDKQTVLHSKQDFVGNPYSYIALNSGG